MSRNQSEIWTKSQGVLPLGAFSFDLEQRELRDAEGQPVALRRQSADVLTDLARHPERTISKGALIEAVCGATAVTDDSLVQCIADIRRTLGPGARDCIRTIPRRGYRLDPTAAVPATRHRFPGNRAIVAGLALTVVAAAALFLLRAGEAPVWTPAGPPLDLPTVAVLPFANMGGDPERVYFSDGLTEDLTTDLSRFSGLRMISSATSFAYRDAGLPPDAIARELGASHLITGSVRRDGRRVRINATLTEAASGANIWADRYDRDIGGIFDLQDDVRRAIVTALAVELTTGEERRLERQLQIDPDAYDLLLRGLPPLRRFTEEGIAEARHYFRRAIEIDPDYARAHANLALSYGQAMVFRLGGDPSSVATALREAERAAELDATIPQTQFALAVVHLSARNHDAAMEAARQAILLDPSYADGFAVLAQTLAYGGDLKEALTAIRTAKKLNPRYTFHLYRVHGTCGRPI
jgi:TolB-like protein/DNA-binding winged helix-turn-helix (wHTH) protein